MSATRSDVSQIQDEDVLRRMWQETEDFGRKKEIRAHMYKIREARLRDFYSSGDDSKDIQRTHSSPGIERKGPANTHHADSLADHSFLSLKSKEIRDSESPTRDVNYKISEKLNQDKGWTIKEKNERSQDGKTFTTSRVATTSGCDKIDGGVANYAAKNEQLASVYQDGDDKNFTKSVGASSKSLIKQEAHGGDENSKFHSTSTTSKSSSKVVTEHKSTSGDYLPSDPSQTVIRKTYTSNVPEERIYDSSQNIIRKTYTTDVPENIKRQIPNYIDGNTRVFTETKTLPDGSTVTTTRYETTGGKATTQSSSNSYSTSSKHVSSSEKNYSSNNVSKQEIKSVRNDNRNINDEVDNVRIIRYTQPAEERNIYVDNEFTTVNKTNRNEDIRSFKNEDIRTYRNEDVRTSRNEDVRTSRNEDIRTSRNEYVDVDRTNKVVQETNLQDVRRYDDSDNRRNIREEFIVTTQPREQVDKNTTVIRTTVVKNVGNVVEDKKVTSDDFINVERQHIRDTQKPRGKSPTKDSPVTTYHQPDKHEQSPKSSLKNYESPRDKSPTKYPTNEQPRSKPDTCSPKYEQPERRQPIKPSQSEFDIKQTDTPYETPTRPRYEQPERRQPATPPKSEMDINKQPTKGQYDTTYRTEFTNKRITVDVSPTHDAFARSLRSVTPERSSPSRGSVRSLRTSTSSLRSSASPEKNRHPTRYSPDRRAGSPTKPSRSPTKFTSTETITKTNRKSPKRTTSTDTITRRRVDSNSTDIITRTTTTKKVDEHVVDGNTLTRRPKRKEVPRSRSTSPTDTVSDFEFISTKHEQVTDLDDVTQKVTTKKDDERPKNLDFSSPRRPKKVTERSPTSPLTDIRKHSPSPTKDSNYPRRSSLKNTPTSPMVSPTKPREDFKPYNPKNKPVEKTDKVLRRTDTYEERCRQILGIVEKKKVEKNITDILFSDRNRPKSPEKKTPRKPSLPDSARRPSPDKFSQSPERKPTETYGKPRQDPTKTTDTPRTTKEISPERKPSKDTPLQRRKSPEKPSEKYPGRKSPTKESPKIQEFPSQVRKSPVKEPMEKYPEKVSPTKDKAPSINEFPSQIRKSPEREPLEPYPERSKPTKESPSVQEFPSQIRKSPERVPLEPYPEHTKPIKEAPTVQEFPSQIRKNPERTPLEPYPEPTKILKESPKIQEFPSQIRKTPEREPLEPYPESTKPVKESPKIQEFPSQIRKSPQREPLEPYPEQTKTPKQAPKVQEFPSQIRKSPQREPLEPYPEQTKLPKEAPKVKEFPSQIRKGPERAPLQPYPELSSPSKVTSKIHEFNNKSTEIYSQQTSSSDEEIRTDECEFPSKIRKSPERETYRRDHPQSRNTPERDIPEGQTSKIQEFPSQIRKTNLKEPLEPYPEKKIPNRDAPKIEEFPSQTRKSPQKEPLEPYPEKRKPVEEGPKIKEFPSQNRKVLDKEPLEPYHQKPGYEKPSPQVQEFPSQIKKSPHKEPQQPYYEKQSPKEDAPKTQEYRTKPNSKIEEFTSQTRKSPTEKKQPLEPYPDRSSPERCYPKTEDYPSNTSKSPERKPSDRHSPETEPTLKPQKFKPVTVTPEFIAKKPKQPKKNAAEDELLEKTTKYIDGKRVPVDEPLFVQKFISQLGSDDEEEIVTETNVTKTRNTITKSRQSPERPSPVRRTDFEDLESEIIEDEKKETIDYVVDEEVDFIVRKSPERLSPVRGIPSNKTQKSVKKDLSRKTQKVTDFITNEKVDTEITLNKITKPNKDVPQNKKTTAKINIVDTRKGKDTKTKIIPIKTTVKEIRLVKPQVTTVKIEGVTKVRESRLDTTRRVQNGEIKSPLKPSQPKTKPMEKTVIRKTINEYPPQRRIDRPTPERKNKPDEKKPVQKLNKPKDDAPKMFPRKEFVIDLKPKKPIEKTPKRAVVSTVINLSPKSKTPTRVIKKTVTTTVTKATKTTPSSSKPKVPKGAKPIQNGHISDEESDMEVLIDENEVTEEVTKISREVSDVTKPSVKIEKTKPKLEKKCVSTKSIIINNTVADQREIIVDLQRSKSSREETPDRVWPVTTEEDSGIPRYPDQILEPEEPIRKPKRTVDVPLTESEDVTEFSRITEIVDTKVTNLQTDECLLSVNEKVNKFLDSVERKKPKKPSGPAPKVERPTLVVDEDLEEDECLLSVTDKVNKFITTAEKLTLQERPKSPRCQNLPNYEDEKSVTSVSDKVSQFTTDKSKPKPKMAAPKVQRPDLTDVEDNLKTDECLLSVSDKVSKFITTAENLTKSEIKREKSPNKKVSLNDIPTDCPTIVDEDDMYIVPKNKKDDQEKPVKLVDIPKQVKPRYPEESKYGQPEIPRTLKEGSPKPKQDVPKTFEDLPKDRRESPTRRLKDEPKVPNDDLPKISKQEAPKITDVTKTRKESPTRRLSDSPKAYGTPKQESPKAVPITRKESPTRKPYEPEDTTECRTYRSPKQETPKPSNVPITRKESPTRKFSEPEDTTPKSTRRPSQEDKIILSSVGRLRSTESIKRARALFENIEKDKPKQRDILSRLSVFEGRKTVKKDDVKLTDIGIEKKHLVDVKKKLIYDEEEDKRVPDVIAPTDEEIPGYMRQLDRSLRDKSPHKQNVLELEEIAKGHIPQTEEIKPTKFGVVLKRTDSERKEERRRSSTVVTEIEGVDKEVEIEEMYDLEILEAMLVKVVSYDIRRRIRAQIRIVKKLISENKLHTVTTVKKIKTTSPTRGPTREKSPEKAQTEYQNKYVRKPSQETKVVDNHLHKHTDLIQERDVTEKTTEYQTSYTYNERRRSSDIRTERREKSPDKTSPTRGKSPIKQTVSKPKTSTTTTTTTTTITNLRKSPERKPKPETKVFSTELKKIVPAAKAPTEDKPEWVTQRNLKKVNERQVTKAKTVTTNVTTKKDTRRSSVSPSKDVKTIDVITSSYGVGPTDENGTPLFGLKALRAQNKNEKTKVQGTVMHSTYYSENGQEPVGEISVTKYSTDPADLGSTEDLAHREGLLSKTTTQKFGYKDTPSYKSLADKKKVTEKNDEIRTTTTTKVSRRGSVKEMSQKFLDNAVDTLKSERQTTYPKAGLILRTSSFKDTGSGSSREGSPTGSEEYHKTVTVKTSSSTKGNVDTFLTNTTKVSNVQDVITRMKTEDIREGESADDAEARSLLNKFLGSQVILAGMEGHVSRGSSSKSSASASATTTTSSSKRVTKVTSTITENGNPKTTTRTFTHPITSDVLETIWDDQTLKLLLEQSTEYEERRIIRLRLKQVMAEKEACSEFVEKTIEESQAGNVEEKVETTKKTFSEGPLTKTQVTTRVTSQQITKKQMSPFAKFRQLDKQNSLNTPPSTPKTPTSGGPLFKFTDPNLSRSASTIKERLLQWCQMKTKEYENIKLDNFSTSWADGLAFCALVHHFLPDAFDYHQLTPNNRRHNFTLAFQVADEKADIAPLLDVEDMVATRRPDWKCVFTYVQSIYRRFKDED